LDVADPEQRIEEMALVDQSRMLGLGSIDPWAGRVGAARVERDGHHLDALRVKLSSQLLPHGQVQAAASP
jgi:hypothetical protein